TSAFALSISLMSSCAPATADAAPFARSAPPPTVKPMKPPMSAVMAASTATFLRPLRRASITSSPSSMRIACGARAGAAAAGATAPYGFVGSAAGAPGGRFVNGGAGTPEGDTGRGELVYVGAGIAAGAAAAGPTPAPTGGGTVEPPAATGALMGELIGFLPRRALRSILGFCSVIGALRGAEKSPILPAVARRRPAQ